MNFIKCIEHSLFAVRCTALSRSSWRSCFSMKLSVQQICQHCMWSSGPSYTNTYILRSQIIYLLTEVGDLNYQQKFDEHSNSKRCPLNVSTISHDRGFGSSSNFLRIFKWNHLNLPNRSRNSLWYSNAGRVSYGWCPRLNLFAMSVYLEQISSSECPWQNLRTISSENSYESFIMNVIQMYRMSENVTSLPFLLYNFESLGIQFPIPEWNLRINDHMHHFSENVTSVQPTDCGYVAEKFVSLI